jgi:hypothetical protein
LRLPAAVLLTLARLLFAQAKSKRDNVAVTSNFRRQETRHAPSGHEAP